MQSKFRRLNKIKCLLFTISTK